MRPDPSTAEILAMTQRPRESVANPSIDDRSVPFWFRHLRREVQFFMDLSVLVIAFLLAWVLRFERLPVDALLRLPLVVLVQLAAMRACGIYSFIWRYIGLSELKSFFKAALSSFAIASAIMLALRLGLPDSFHLLRVPISVVVLDTVLAFGGLLTLRIVRRMLYERFEQQLHPDSVPYGRRQTKGKRVLLVGAGRAGMMAARELTGQAMARDGGEILGFLDDDPRKQGSVIQGLKVLGPTRELPQWVEELNIERVLLTMVKVDGEKVRHLLNICRRLGVEVRIMPGLFEILEGRLNVSRFREVRIEDLLRREPVRLDDEDLAAFFRGKRIMVTGAGGSIGAELARQVARFDPERLFLVERAEPALFEVHREILSLWHDLDVQPLLADVSDRQRMRSLLWQERPQVILHAAAHKHVPMMEANPGEALKNNSLATYHLGQLAGELGVERFVLVSTDKAVNPTSIMGSSKRLAELLIQELDRQFETRYLAVRFGNVLGSTGSVIPIFRQQIDRGGPITVTHPDMVRYFMTIPEAAQLVLHSASMGEGGEIFVLDMGEPVKILDLAKDMIHLANLRLDKDIKIEIIGTRPGEKLYEELEQEEERLTKTRHPKIFIGNLQAPENQAISDALPELERLAHGDDPIALRHCLATLLPESQLESVESLAS